MSRQTFAATILAVATLALASSISPSAAQQLVDAPSAEPALTTGSFDTNAEPKTSALRRVASEVAILRYRTALKLTAAQEKYWPAAASALRALARQAQLDETVVRRYAPAVKPLIASLNDQQRQVAMGLAQQAGLAQYAAMF
jgi:hypothetical protein